jgi:hypothetical protein
MHAAIMTTAMPHMLAVCRTALASTSCSPMRCGRCSALEAVHGLSSSARIPARSRRLHGMAALSSSSSLSSPQPQSVVGRSAFTSNASSSKEDSEVTTPENLSKPRLRANHELYAISSKKKRVVLFNEETASKLVNAMHLEKQKNLVVLDLYAG